jgi:DNA repair exonuclease SbcCD ATPase subunit
MATCTSDRETVNNLVELTRLIENGLAKAWDPKVVAEAKQQLAVARDQFQSSIQKTQSQVEEVESQVEDLKQQSDKLSYGLEAVNDLHEALNNWGGVDKLREDLSKLEEVRTLVSQVREGQEAIEGVQIKTQQVQEAAAQLNSTLSELGGAEAFTQQLGQLGEVAAALANLDQRIELSINTELNKYIPDFESGKQQIYLWQTQVSEEVAQALNNLRHRCDSTLSEIDGKVSDSVTTHINEYLPAFEAGKLQIEQWQSEVLTETKQNLSHIEQVRDATLSTLDSKVEQSISAHTHDFLSKLEVEKEKSEVLREQIAACGRQNLDSMQQLHESIRQSAATAEDNISQINLRFQNLDAREEHLQEVITAIEKLSSELGGKDSFETFTGQLQRLEELIRAEKAEFEAIRKNIYAEFQQLFFHELEETRKQFRADINSLREELNFDIKSYRQECRNELDSLREEIGKDVERKSEQIERNSKQIQQLRAKKCDRPFWAISNWKIPKVRN